MQDTVSILGFVFHSLIHYIHDHCSPKTVCYLLVSDERTVKFMTDCVVHRRRIETEGKGKVMASVWGA